jgi:GT2 family glycosyltransferase
MPDQVRASLIVPVFKGWDHVDGLLAGILPAPSWLQVLIVDDASSDGGAEALAEREPGVQVVIRRSNGGFAAAVNTGVRASVGKTLIIANSDLVLETQAVESLVAISKVHPSLVLGPRTVRRNGAEIRIAQRFPTPARDAAELFVPARLWRSLAHRLGRANPRGVGPIRCDWVVGSCMVFDRALWSEVGGLDESFGMYSEEIDFQHRAAALAYGSAYVPQVTAIHDETHGATRISESTDRRFRAIWKARVRYLERYQGASAIRQLRALWLAAYLVSAPVWALLQLWPPLSADARAELRRVSTLARAALRGGS